MNLLEGNDWYSLSLNEKVDTVISILNTPIFKRRLNDPGLSKAILDIDTKLHRKEEKDGTEKI
ncbi:MAG: hypothetical protein J6Q39_09315 [Bacteroidales bacterium]|jgi:hypothetical protein|nr:hypothetical protein [Bacteroidales bacterium]